LSKWTITTSNQYTRKSKQRFVDPKPKVYHLTKTDPMGDALLNFYAFKIRQILMQLIIYESDRSETRTFAVDHHVDH
jgi:hypothetical protein